MMGIVVVLALLWGTTKEDRGSQKKIEGSLAVKKLVSKLSMTTCLILIYAYREKEAKLIINSMNEFENYFKL